MILNKLEKQGVIHPPKWLISNVQYLVYMGSVAYGVSSESSDNDVYGFTIPPLEQIFPHLSGELLDFGKQKQRFGQWQEHKIIDQDTQKEYDFTVYGIVKYFDLVMSGNPNMLDSLYVPTNCVLHSTQIGNLLRENKKMFLHKGCWQKFKGYSYSSLHKAETKEHKGLRELQDFEKNNGISSKTTFNEVLEEIKRRNLFT